jgi:hypothetical protein
MSNGNITTNSHCNPNFNSADALLPAASVYAGEKAALPDPSFNADRPTSEIHDPARTNTRNANDTQFNENTSLPREQPVVNNRR